MDFDLNDDQREIAATVRALLAKRSDPLEVRAAIESTAGYDTDLWAGLCGDLGAAAILIPEEYDGLGLSLVEAQLVLEELGAALTPSPFLSSAVLVVRALMLSDDAEAKSQLLSQIGSGAKVAALAWADESGHWRTDGGDLVADSESVTGSATLVLDGADCDILLAVANGADGPAIYQIADVSRVRREVTGAMDQTLQLATLRFEGTPARRLKGTNQQTIRRLLAEANSMVAGMQVGTARRGLEMTVEYAQQRRQFGRPIGSFQALKHRMANMYVAVETARTMALNAAWQAAHGTDLPEAAAMAKVWCSDALDLVAAETVQLHGGIAITWEHDAHLVFKRAHATRQLFGAPEAHRQQLFRSAKALQD